MAAPAGTGLHGSFLSDVAVAVEAVVDAEALGLIRGSLDSIAVSPIRLAPVRFHPW